MDDHQLSRALDLSVWERDFDWSGRGTIPDVDVEEPSGAGERLVGNDRQFVFGDPLDRDHRTVFHRSKGDFNRDSVDVVDGRRLIRGADLHLLDVTGVHVGRIESPEHTAGVAG
jgi:hypothetical protein